MTLNNFSIKAVIYWKDKNITLKIVYFGGDGLCRLKPVFFRRKSLSSLLVTRAKLNEKHLAKREKEMLISM